ncbi:MAG: oxaloacetate decarboxylase subunit alpha, partial [Schwartzia sp.]|nr:oxaloacetate decarboxylase subunit alpha [Schwartzia sp. (in: firmicutes)]
KEMGMEDKYQDLLDEMPRVRADLGFPPLVTPSSQIVGTMATMNVMMGQRYKMVPKEVKDLARGKFGRTPKPIDREFLIKTLGIPENEIIDDCAKEDAKEKTVAQFKEQLAGKGYANAPEEDVLSYALFPQVAEEFFKSKGRM